MAFSAIYLARTSGVNDFIIRSAEAADADEMERVVALHLAEIQAINAGIDLSANKFMPVDANLAAAGDGHSFIFTVTFTRTSIAAVESLIFASPLSPLPLAQAPGFIDPGLFVTKFAIAAEQDALDAAIQDAARRLLDSIAGTPGADATSLVNFLSIAGGSKGQRFMVGMSGLPAVFRGN